MNTALVLVRNEEEKELSYGEFLGKTLLERTVDELKKANINDIYIVGYGNEKINGVKNLNNIYELNVDELEDGKCILTSPFYPLITNDDYKKLLAIDNGGAIAAVGEEVYEIYMIPNKDLNNFENIDYTPVEIDADRLIKIGDDEFEVIEDDEEEFIDLDEEEEEFKNMKIFALPSCENIVDEITDYLGVKPGKIDIEHFADGETLVEIGESVRGKRIFLVQSTCAPVNERLMELLIAMNALKLSSASSIGVIMPYFGYARQDRKAKPRQPITAKLVADLLETAGAYRVVTFDLHAAQIEGFFNFPVDNLSVIPMMADYYLHNKELDLENTVIVSPDHGGVNRARRLAEAMGVAQIAIIDKRRPRPNEVEVANIIGNVSGMNCIIVDDICDTGGSLCAAAKTLKDNGANDVYVCLAHGVFSRNAIERIEESEIKELVVTNSIPQKEGVLEKSSKIVTLSVARMLAEVIKAITLHAPISPVYDMYSHRN